MARRDELTDRTVTASTSGAIDPEPRAVALDAAPGRAESLVPGDAVARYHIRAHLGAGGMGEVFVAHDPELDRELALKILKPEIAGSSPEVRARFQREAQAMARLNHPNVVAVYDVLTVADRVFVAMELVRGPTLKQWLAETKRTWRDALKVMIEAGRGLEAAHAAGIVHRDFKPSNVIVGDRVRVADFGLARGGAGEDVPAVGSPSVVLDATVTASGKALGTSAYMAPEQRAGLPATAASDQYAFAVTMHEALYGVRPGADEPQTTSGVPRWLRAVVARSLAEDPAHRYPSMRQLLADLVGTPARRQRWFIGTGAIAVAGLVAALARAGATGEEEPCRDASARLAGVWDDGRRSAIAAAFAATDLPDSSDAWDRTRRRIDDYAARWVNMHEEACRATRIEGRQSEHVLDLRMACLDRRRAILDAVASRWSHNVSPAAMRDANDAAQRLDPIDDCADVRALTEPAVFPTQAPAFARVRAAQARVDFAQALLIGKRWPEGWSATVAARREADASGWPHVQAEAAYVQGRAASNLDEPDPVPFFQDAIRFATESRDDVLIAKAYVALVRRISDSAKNAQQVLLLADLASSAVARAGNEPRLRARITAYRAEAFLSLGKLDEAEAGFVAAHDQLAAAYGSLDIDALLATTNRARVLRTKGDYRAARQLQEALLQQTTEALGGFHPRVATVLQNLGVTASIMGDRDAAASYDERALAIQEKVLGSEVGATALTVAALAILNLERGHLAEAEPQFRRALATQERVFGPESEEVATGLVGFGVLKRKLGHPDQSQALLERAQVIFSKAYGAEHPSVAYAHDHLGELREAAGDATGALTHYDRALALRVKGLGADHPMTLASVGPRARILIERGRCTEVRAELAKAIEGFTKIVGDDDTKMPDFADTLAINARCDAREHHVDAAIRGFERALRIKQNVHAPAVEQGDLHWRLAQLRWELGDHDEALAEARLAATQLAADHDGSRALADVTQWVANRGGASDSRR